MPTTRLYLVRHAESTWNRERRMQGYADPPLTPEGVLQADALAKRIAPDLVDFLVASDLGRAISTAQAIAAVTGLTIETQPAWREQDMGEWTGLTRPQIEQQWPREYATYRDGDLTIRPGGGESRRMFRERILGARAWVEQRFEGRRVLVVTHRGAIRFLMPHINPPHAELFELAPGG